MCNDFNLKYHNCMNSSEMRSTTVSSVWKQNAVHTSIKIKLGTKMMVMLISRFIIIIPRHLELTLGKGCMSKVNRCSVDCRL